MADSSSSVSEGSFLRRRYLITSKLGEGGFADVYRAYDCHSGLDVALKVAKPSVKNDDYGAAQQFETEVSALNFIFEKGPASDYNIVHLMDCFEVDGRGVIVLELLGMDMWDYILNNGRQGLPMEQIRELTVQLLNALSFLSCNRVVHMDLKPGNILFCDHICSTVKLADFGMASIQGRAPEGTEGTFCYAPPEYLLGFGYDSSFDMWSLGCVLTELHTGQILFQGESRYDVVMRMMEVLGPFDTSLLRRSPHKLQFLTRRNHNLILRPDELGRVRKPGTLPLRQLLAGCPLDFITFVEGCLTTSSSHRLTAQAAMQHPWISGSPLGTRGLSPITSPRSPCTAQTDARITCVSHRPTSDPTSTHTATPHCTPYTHHLPTTTGLSTRPFCSETATGACQPLGHPSERTNQGSLSTTAPGGQLSFSSPSPTCSTPITPIPGPHIPGPGIGAPQSSAPPATASISSADPGASATCCSPTHTTATLVVTPPSSTSCLPCTAHIRHDACHSQDAGLHVNKAAGPATTPGASTPPCSLDPPSREPETLPNRDTAHAAPLSHNLTASLSSNGAHGPGVPQRLEGGGRQPVVAAGGPGLPSGTSGTSALPMASGTTCSTITLPVDCPVGPDTVVSNLMAALELNENESVCSSTCGSPNSGVDLASGDSGAAHQRQRRLPLTELGDNQQKQLADGNGTLGPPVVVLRAVMVETHPLQHQVAMRDSYYRYVRHLGLGDPTQLLRMMNERRF